MDAPPDDLPRYRLLTGPDDDAFCRRVSEALGLGYQLYGSPAMTHDGTTVVVGQALIWPGAEAPNVPGASSRRAGFGFPGL
jgi:hypothetical protein